MPSLLDRRTHRSAPRMPVRPGREKKILYKGAGRGGTRGVGGEIRLTAV